MEIYWSHIFIVFILGSCASSCILWNGSIWMDFALRRCSSTWLCVRYIQEKCHEVLQIQLTTCSSFQMGYLPYFFDSHILPVLKKALQTKVGWNICANSEWHPIWQLVLLLQLNSNKQRALWIRQEQVQHLQAYSR